jgi:hypothetical protein
MATEQDVLLQYLNTLNRKPDAGGQSFWNGAAGSMPPGALNAAFESSPEFKSGPGVNWGTLGEQSKAYMQGMRNAPFVFNMKDMPSDKQGAFDALYAPRQQAGGVAPIRGPNNVNVGPQASDLGVHGLLSGATNGSGTMAWPDMLKGLQQSNPDVAGLLAQLFNPTGGSSGGPMAPTTPPATIDPQAGMYFRGPSDY